MLISQQPLLKRFWYAVIPMDHLTDGSKPFELLGQTLVIWLNREGQPVATEDRCCHRSAKLSQGIVVDGNIRCPYHGWEFNGSGTCVKVPQLSEDFIPKTYQVKSFLCQERYGYVWVCLHDEPLYPIPEIPEASDPSFRQIHEFYETWNCASLRMTENEFDSAHVAIVHANSFGHADHLVPDYSEFEEFDGGFHNHQSLSVANPPLQQQNISIVGEKTSRKVHFMWFMPFTSYIHILYPNGLRHIIVSNPTPIRDDVCQVVQFCLRNDTEADAPASQVIAFDRIVTQEDQAILENTDCDVPLDLSKEQHMATDKPGLLIRRKLAALLKAHSEPERCRIPNS